MYHNVYITGCAIIPVIWQLIALSVCPESPRYLMLTKHEQGEAEKGLCFSYILRYTFPKYSETAKAEQTV